MYDGLGWACTGSGITGYGSSMAEAYWAWEIQASSRVSIT
jgi:hypothetical protein